MAHDQAFNLTAAARSTARIALISLCVFLASPSQAQNGVQLTGQIRECPTEGNEPNHEFIVAPAAAAILTSIATGIVVNLAGQAVDALTSYLEQEQSAVSETYMPLSREQESSLLDGSRCFYAYANTPRLKNYLSGKKIDTKVIEFIKKERLTPFFSVIKLEKEKSSTSSATEPSYYKPKIEAFIYESFLGNGCPIFRNCSKRDVSITLKVMNPNPSQLGEPSSKSTPLSLLFNWSSPKDIERSLNNQYQNFGWFTHANNPSSPSNLSFVLKENSKPGAIAKSFAAALKENRESISKSIGSYVIPPRVTPAEKETLAEKALTEFQKYATLHQDAQSYYDSGVSSADQKIEYALLKRKVALQLQISKAAWSAASIPQRFQELPPLP